MHWLKTPTEYRANPLEDPNTPIGKALMFLGDDWPTSITGRPMGERSALSLAAFWAGVTVISADIATSSLKLYRKTDNGGREEETGHPLSEIFATGPHDMITSASWREASQAHLLTRGNAYSEIFTNGGGDVIGLMPLNPRDVTRKGEIYEIRDRKPVRRVHASRILHIPGPGGNGVDGWSVLSLARQNLSLAQALEESNTRFIANASRPSGFISTPEPLDPEAVSRLKGQWATKNTGLDHVGNVPVLDNGMTWQQLSLNAEDAQYVESRRFSVSDVCRWLNLNPHKLKDLDRATFSNIEELQVDHVTGTLRPWAVRWEQCMAMKLLTEQERRAGLYIEHNMDSLLRGDIETRSVAYRSQFEIGALTTNEIRQKENRDPVDGGDRPMVRLDMVPLDRIDQVQSVTTDDEGLTEIRFAERRTEQRSHRHRLRLRDSFLPLFTDAADRLIRGEVRDVRRLVENADTEVELHQAITDYYFGRHVEWSSDVIGPVFRSYAESVSSASAEEIDSEVRIDTVTYSDAYRDTFVVNHAARSRRDLVDLEAEQIETRLVEWREGTANAQPRHNQIAGRQVVELGDAVAKATWMAGGIVTLAWRTIGDSCPYCMRLNGTIVDIRVPFIKQGEEFEGDDTDVPLVPKSSVGHAPAHRGCNCTIVPG